MAVLDGHHEAATPTDPVGSALGKLLRALPGAGGPAGRGGPDGDRAGPGPRRRPARPGDHRPRWCRPAAEHRRIRLGYRSEAGAEWSPEVDPWAVVVRHGRWYLLCWSHSADARRAYRIDRVVAVRAARRPGSPRRPTSTRSPSWRTTSRSAGSTRSRSSSTPRSSGWRAACPATLGRLEPVDARHQPAGRQHQQPGVVRRAARDPAGRVPDRALPGAATVGPPARPPRARRRRRD